MSAGDAQGYADIAERVPSEQPLAEDARRVRWIKREPQTMVWSEWDPTRACRVVVKLYRRRGLAAYGRMRLSRFRAEREFLVLSHLAAHGLPCSEPLAWAHGHHPAHGFYEALVTRELTGMRNLEDHLAELPTDGSAPPPDLSPLAALLRRMHACGCYHGVMKPSNVMIGAADTPTPSFALIDLDMARVFPRDLYGTWVGRFDLLEMCSYLLKLFGAAALRQWLPSYGLRDGEIETFLQELAVYAQRSRRWRRGPRRRVHLASLWGR